MSGSATAGARPIAVTGASGWVGARVCVALAAEGHAVRRLVRRSRADGEMALDLAGEGSEASWTEALRGCATVIHCAAHVHRPNETPAERELFMRVNVTGTGRLLAAARAAGVSRFVFVSSVAVYDWSGPDGETRGEGAPLAPATAYGQSKYEGERLVQAWPGDWCIARLATIYGDGDRANFARLAAALKRGRFLLPGDGGARKSVLPVDLAGVLLARLARPEGGTGIFNLALPIAPTLAEIFRSLNPAAQVTACKDLSAALNASKDAPFAVITGSLYLVGEALERLGLAPADAGGRALNEWCAAEIRR